MEESHSFKGNAGDIVGDVYELVECIGYGTFSSVWSAKHILLASKVALKFIRGIKKYCHEAQKYEVSILHQVKDCPGVVRCLDTFNHGPHFVMVFPCLGESLYAISKKRIGKGARIRRKFPPKMLHSIADQFITTLAYLHTKCNVIHTDLKPENLVFTDPKGGTDSVTLIDFGTAIRVGIDHKGSIISTRQYRAPEVIVESGDWSYPADIWSYGCILMELYTGTVLFQTHNSLEHLNMIERCIGKRFPWYMSENRRFFHNTSERFIKRTILGRFQPTLYDLIDFEDSCFFDLIQQCLEIDPRKRITAVEAMNHMYFTRIRGRKELPHTIGISNSSISNSSTSSSSSTDSSSDLDYGSDG